MSTVPVPGPDRVIRVEATSLAPDERSTLSAYLNAVEKVLSGDLSAALKFEGAEIAGQRLPTDPDDIEDLDDQGVWDDLDFYSSEPPTAGL
jgi:hypothetical protein